MTRAALAPVEARGGRRALRASSAPSSERAKRAPKSSPAAEKSTLRMRDLCALTGLERQTIHFYIQEGLVPEGRKVGRNMAFYGPEHLERLRLVKKLQQERFLPLRAIRAVLGGKLGGFSTEQRALLGEVKAHLAQQPEGAGLVRSGGEHCVEVRELATRCGLPSSDIEEMIDLGLMSAEGGPRTRRVRREDEWLVEAWAELARAGLNRARGFSPKDLALIDEAVTELFARERELFVERFENGRPEDIASALTRALPILSRVLSRLHEQKARDTFELVAEAASPTVEAANATPRDAFPRERSRT
jgi:DNA-binding transcriptional MerR regulator